MLNTLPLTAEEFATWDWVQIRPYFDALEAKPITEQNAEDWLKEWARLIRLVNESNSRLYVATTLDTTDKTAEERYRHYQTEVMERYEVAQQRLKEKFIANEQEPAGFSIAMRDMLAEAALFREVNVPLQTQNTELNQRYNRIIGTQTVTWQGEETTLPQLGEALTNPDRSVREAAWRLAMARRMEDRETLNQLWAETLHLRREIAHNAGLPDYRTYRWKELKRFDYTPDDAKRFRDAIEAVVVPAATRIYERYRQQQGFESVRPWDLSRDIDVLQQPPLRPYEDADTLLRKTSHVFHRVDPQLGEYFDIMQRENLLDLFNRKGKAPGGYCTTFSVVKRPFIFMNAVGLHDDVQTLLHEGGHAFHTFECAHLPYEQQADVPIEFCEVASMSMELLGGPYMDTFYSPQDSARARIEHLESIITFWPYMAVVDGFQDWAHTHVDDAVDPSKADAAWLALWNRFMPGIDWSGFEEEAATGWQRKQHIFRNPFYYIEYGLAQLGAVQVWRNSLEDQAGAVTAYRKALALGGTVSLPDLFAAAGAKFQPDEALLRELVRSLESAIEQLERM